MLGTVFKNFVKGILYVFLFPLILVGVALYGVFGLFVFLSQFVRMIYLFFTGRNLNSDLDEDLQVKAKLAKPEEEVKENPTDLSLYPSDSPMYTTNYTSPTFEKEETGEAKEIEEEENNDY